MVPPVTTEPRRKRGRPRSTTADEAIQAAVIALLDIQGYTGLRIDDVADTSRVSKTTIYRRWPTKAALVVDVLRQIKSQQIPMPSTGDIEQDLRAIVTDLYASLDGTTLGRALPGLLAEKSADPELAAAIEQLWTDRQKMVGEVVRRGVANGQLRPDLDVATVLDQLAGPAYYRLLITGQRLDRRSARRHADALVIGMRSTHPSQIVTSSSKG
jgi:AcrR family transcriptional regulator